MDDVYPELEEIKRDIPEPIMRIIEETAKEHNTSVDVALCHVVAWVNNKHPQELDLDPVSSEPPIEQMIEDAAREAGVSYEEFKETHDREAEQIIARMEAAKDDAIKVVCRTREDQLRLLDQYIVPDYLPPKLKTILQRTTIKQLKDGMVAFLPPSEDEKSGNGYYPVFFIA
jgi:hypothetical protein